MGASLYPQKWAVFYSFEEGASGHHVPLAVWVAKWSSLVYKPCLLITPMPSQDCTQLPAAGQERNLLIEKHLLT